MNNQQLDLKNKENKKLESVTKILGEPVFIGLSDYVLKLRRNLVALSATIIFYKWSGVKIANIFGLDCSYVQQHKIDIALFVSLVFSGAHFFSEAGETYLRWKIRLSGTFVPVPIGALTTIKLDERRVGLSDADCPDNQLSLYTTVQQLAKHHEHELVDINRSNHHNYGNSIKKMEGILEGMKESLDNYQKGFKKFQIVQVIRFLSL